MSGKVWLFISVMCFLYLLGSCSNTDDYSRSSGYSSSSYSDRASEDYYRSIGFSKENAKRAVETEKALDYLMSND